MLFQRSENPGEDIRRFTEMVPNRRAMIDEAPATPLPSTYAVNELSKALHPGTIPAEIVEIKDAARNCKTIVLKSKSENGRFPYFRAGQFITLSAKIGEALVTRPYSLSSSPKQALEGYYEVTVQRAGFFSSWLLDEAEVGTKLIVGEPSGDFYHDDIRDAKTIVAIAGGSGVTPFISMIKAIEEGSDEFDLVLIYGARTREDLIITSDMVKNEHVKIVIVLSDEEVEGYEKGFITEEVLRRYVPKQASFFMCGPDAMYRFVGSEIVKTGVADTDIRREHNSVRNREVADPKTFTLTVRMRERVYEIPAKQEETLLAAMERAGLAAPSRCRSGSCGFCHSRLISGECTIPEEHDSRRKADLKFGYLHPCCTYPDSDMEIEVPLYSDLEG